MKLIDILVRKLPGLGGWPKDKTVASRGPNNCVMFHELGVKPLVYAGLKFEGNDIVTKEEYEAALAASKPEWNGEGLPPAGCEFLFGTHQTKAKCIAVGRDVIFASTGSPDEKDGFYEEFVISIHHSEFSPIRSEADKKRDSIISKIEKAYKDCPHSDAVPQAIYEAIAEHIRID